MRESSVKSAYRTKAVQLRSRGNRYSPKPGTLPSQHLAISKINSGFHARKNPFERAISKSSQIRELHETKIF